MAAWPEQMVLVELARRCNALLALPSAAPIARLLTFVESLLFKITDWEAYASRETSLSAFSDRLTALVVEWRRLELRSWAGLLEAQERAFREPVAEWWFRLFDLCVHGPNALLANGIESSTDSEYVETLLRLVRTFIEESPAGQFRDKLHLVESFAKFTASIEQHSHLFARISTVLSNLVNYYEAQALRIDAFLRDEKKRIAKDVNEVIRLASWKDVNVYALKASAQKSHRQLYKRVRALRKALDAPASQFAEGNKPSSVVEAPRDPKSGVDITVVKHSGAHFTPLPELAGSGIPKSLVNIETTLSRLEEIVAKDCRTSELMPTETHLDILAESIITRSRELRAEQPTGNTKEERQKQGNALMDRKRKAWSSLLAETKRIGLSARPSTTLVQSLSRMSTLFEAGPLFEDRSGQSDHRRSMLKSLDSYFYCLCAIMPQVRSAPSQHHADVIPSQLQAAAGFLDSALRMIHSTRKDISGELASVLTISQTCRKLQILQKEGIVTCSIESLETTVRTFRTNFSLLQCALEEILKAGQEHVRFMGSLHKAAFSRLQVNLQDYVREVQATSQQLDTVLQDEGNTAPTTGVHLQALTAARGVWNEVVERLCASSSAHPQMDYLLGPTLAWMKQNTRALDWHQAVCNPNEAEISGMGLERYTAAMSAILVCTQKLNETPYAIIEENDDYVNSGLALQYRQLREKAQHLHIGSIGQRMQGFMAAMAGMTMCDSGSMLASQLVDRYALSL